MKEAEIVANEIIEKFSFRKCVCNTLRKEFCTCISMMPHDSNQSALIHVEGLIELTKFYAPNISTIREELEEVKTIIENK